MKVYIGPYTSWFGPYQLAEKLCFWAKPTKDEHGFPQKPDWIHKFGEWLAHGDVEPEPKAGDIVFLDRERHKTLLYRFLLWVESRKQRKIKIRIDRWDTWSMDHTLALIVLPMLKKLKEEKHGAPWVEDEDVPEELRSTAAPPKKDEWDTDDNHFKRWDWVLDEMIFSFNSEVDDSWEEQFHSGEYEGFAFKKLDNGLSELLPSGNRKYDFEGRKEYQKRITNGFRLFGKYYQNLWD